MYKIYKMGNIAAHVSIHEQRNEYNILISNKVTNFHQFIWKIFSLGKIRIYTVQNKEGLVVASAEVMPKIFIFSFMKGKQSIHIDPCYVNEKYRCRGIYTNLLKKIISDFPTVEKYIFCAESNIPSMKGIEKAGFQFLGYGKKGKLGIYKMISYK